VAKVNDSLVGVIGLGYVGLPLARLFAKKGFCVIGFDIDKRKVNRLNSGKSYISYVASEDIQGLLRDGRFSATSDFKRLKEPDVLIICVPTPLREDTRPDLSYVISTTKLIHKSLRSGQIVVLESTTYPGTTRQVLLPILQEKGLRCGRDFFLAYSPERENPGDPSFTTENIPKLVGGVDERSTRVAGSIYRKVVLRVIEVSSAEVAEAAKMLENIYRCINSALVNELKILFEKMGIDIWEVIEAASTKPFGFQPFYPGPGMGGHCIPIDPFYLAWKAREYQVPLRFVELAGEINRQMPYYVVGRLEEGLKDQRKRLKDSHILVLGVAYKKDTDDPRESPAFKIMEILQERGAKVSYHDPYIPRLPRMRHHTIRLSSVKLTPSFLRGVDGVVIVTDHSLYDYDLLVKNAPLVVDTRNATVGVRRKGGNIILA
jgi:UDP-N-acetyl-D-glucosamine dehydrogenase